MSADNAIYIRPLPNGKYAVDCISSLYPEYLTEEQIDKEFENAPQFDTLEKAEEEERRIEKEYYESGSYIEYGTEILYRRFPDNQRDKS